MIEECASKSYNERLEVVGLTTLESRRSRADLIEVFKILKGFEEIDENLFFKRHVSNTRGHSLKSANSINSFKNNLDKFLKASKGGVMSISQSLYNDDGSVRHRHFGIFAI